MYKNGRLARPATCCFTLCYPCGGRHFINVETWHAASLQNGQSNHKPAKSCRYPFKVLQRCKTMIGYPFELLKKFRTMIGYPLELLKKFRTMIGYPFELLNQFKSMIGYPLELLN